MKIIITATPSQDALVSAVKQAGFDAQTYKHSEGVFYNKQIRLGYLSSVCHEIAEGHCRFGNLSLSEKYVVELCPDSTLQIATLEGELLWSLRDFDEKKARVLLDCGVSSQALSSSVRIEF